MTSTATQDASESDLAPSVPTRDEMRAMERDLLQMLTAFQEIGMRLGGGRLYESDLALLLKVDVGTIRGLVAKLRKGRDLRKQRLPDERGDFWDPGWQYVVAEPCDALTEIDRARRKRWIAAINFERRKMQDAHFEQHERAWREQLLSGHPEVILEFLRGRTEIEVQVWCHREFVNPRVDGNLESLTENVLVHSCHLSIPEVLALVLEAASEPELHVRLDGPSETLVVLTNERYDFWKTLNRDEP